MPKRNDGRQATEPLGSDAKIVVVSSSLPA